MKSKIHEYKKSKLQLMSKKLILIIALVLVSNTLFAQTVFDKFDNQDDVTAIIVNKKMFSMLSKVDIKDKESQQYVNLIKKLDNLKVFVTENSKKGIILSQLESSLNKILNSAGLQFKLRYEYSK
jgi:hypothetical protein